MGRVLVRPKCVMCAMGAEPFVIEDLESSNTHMRTDTQTAQTKHLSAKNIPRVYTTGARQWKKKAKYSGQNSSHRPQQEFATAKQVF